jgi:hypothetical protein
MKESFTINKPHIADDFVTALMSEHRACDSGDVSFSTAHLNTCLAQLASDVMVRERQNFEAYSMFYENLLRIKEQLLYQKEQVRVFYSYT